MRFQRQQTVRSITRLVSGMVTVVFFQLWISSWTKAAAEAQPSAKNNDSLLFRPELYHGQGKSHHFFEGWYHKLVKTNYFATTCSSNETAEKECAVNGDNNDDSLSMAVVPGVFYDSGNNHNGKNESHAFIFVTIHGEQQHYYRFDLETELDYLELGGDTDSSKDYYVKIGNNRFSNNGMVLDLQPRNDDDASVSIQGSVHYRELSPWPIPSIWNLGAMGPVGFFLSPFLECYHDVLSMDHKLEGNLSIQSTTTTTTIEQSTEVVFDGTDSSRGYVEKDRGRAFPSLWIWMQTNSFSTSVGTSLFFSVARIPILTPLGAEEDSKFSILTLLKNLSSKLLPPLEFPGFTAAVWLNSDSSNGNKKQLIPFATWSGAYFEDLVVTNDKVVATLHSGGGGDSTSSTLLWAMRYTKAWIGSWFLPYDSRKHWYKLELEADRRVPHVLLYAPKTTTTTITNDGDSESHSKMEPFVNEALHSKVSVRLVEYSKDPDGIVHERVLLDDVGEHAGLEVHQNVQYLVDNLCGKPGASLLACL